MNSPLSPLWSLDVLTPADAHALLSVARALKQAPGGAAPLKGKHLALLCERPLRPATDVFSTAARGLGAQVTRIGPHSARLAETGDLDEIGEVRGMARILGRLYDAIECDGMGEALMRELLRAAAVPVFNVLRRERHPTRLLADVMTMLEISPGPSSQISVCVVGDERAPWSVAWRQIAAVTGIAVRAGTRPLPQGLELAAAADVAFVCDPQWPRCADGQPALLALRRSDARAVSLAARQVANHCYVVQALLAQTIA
jgi:ornithine carbamoyltransferase